MIKCGIFDLDGTIVNSMPYWEKTPKEYINKLGFEPKENLCERFLSLSLPEGAKYLIDTYNLDKTVDEVCDGIDSIMEYNYSHHVEVKKNFRNVLELFKKYGVKMAIASSTDKPLILKAIKNLDLDKYFDFVISSTEIGLSKQHPDIYLKCCDHFGVKPSESIIFEDLPYGLIATKPYNFYSVGIFDKTSILHQNDVKANSTFYFDEINDKELEILESLLKIQEQ